MSCKTQSQCDAMFRSYPERFVALNRLFEVLAAAKHPDFLMIMAAIDEVGAFTTKDDTLVVDDCIDNLKMSLNKCRFCA